MINGLIGGMLIVLLAGSIIVRLLLNTVQKNEGQNQIGISQTTGQKELQADVAHAIQNEAGMMAVLADGIGRENTGKVCAQLAADMILDHFEPYHVLNKPLYFFRSTFAEANRYIQKTIGDRRGGASLAAVFISRSHIYYGVAGNIRIALMRNHEIIPLNQGQTLDVLAVQAYQAGKISRQETLWSMDEKRVWNYIGQDGFHEIEVCKKPIHIKNGDWILLISKGIFEELSWGEIEDIMQKTDTAKRLADQIVQEAERKADPEMDNGSILLLKLMTEASYEKDKL